MTENHAAILEALSVSAFNATMRLRTSILHSGHSDRADYAAELDAMMERMTEIVDRMTAGYVPAKGKDVEMYEDLDGITPLYGHTSPETAYVVEDYPYGFRLRCRMRYWLENHPRRGSRLCSQSTNPKVTDREVWNKPKKSTYALLTAVMFLDEKGHVRWTALNPSVKPAEVRQFFAAFPKATDAEGLNALVRAKMAYESVTAAGGHLFLINGKPHMPTAEEVASAQVELEEWRAILRDMMDGKLSA